MESLSNGEQRETDQKRNLERSNEGDAQYRKKQKKKLQDRRLVRIFPFCPAYRLANYRDRDSQRWDQATKNQFRLDHCTEGRLAKLPEERTLLLPGRMAFLQGCCAS